MSFIKKLAPIAAGALFTGMTVMSAVALDLAAYPAPFVDGGKADVGIVFGSSAASYDNIAAVDIALNLQSYLSGTGSSGGVVSGEGVNLATSNTKIYYGSYIDVARTSLTKTELPTVLADGEVTDDNGNIYKYTQSITIGNSTIDFSNSGSDIVDPVLLINMGTTALDPIYRYDVAFSKELNVSSTDVQGNSISIMGQDFTIGASSTSTILYLYGVGTGLTLKEGESSTVTVGGNEYTVSVDGVSSTTVGMITVNGVSKEVTEGSIYTFGDIEVYAKNVFYLAKESQVSQIELSLGSKRLKLQNGYSVKYGSDDTSIKNTYATVTAGATGGYISGFKIYQAAEKSKYDHIGIGESYTDRVFDTVKVSFKDVIPALDSTARATLVVDTDNSRTARVTFTDALHGKELASWVFAYDIDTTDSAATTVLAHESNKRIYTKTNQTFGEGEYVIINSGDYGRILEVDSVDLTSGGATTDSITFSDVISGENFKAEGNFTAGARTLNIDGQTYTVHGVGTANGSITWGSTNTIFPRFQLKNGAWMAILNYESFTSGSAYILPGNWDKTTTTTITAGATTGSVKVNNINYTTINVSGTYYINGIDYNDDATIDCNFNATYGPAILLLEEYLSEGSSYLDAICIPLDETGTTTVELSVAQPKFESSTSYTPSLVSLTSDTYKQQAVDRFGSWIEYDTTDNDKVTVKYPDEQMYASIYISEEAAAITAGSAAVAGGVLGSVVVTDADIASVQGKNLIVIGGSAINSVAAKLLGVTYPTYGTDEAWKTATGVNTNMAIIKMFDNPYTAGKVAMLIAGYEGKDTKAAAKALTSGTPELSGESALLNTVSESSVTIVTA